MIKRRYLEVTWKTKSIYASFAQPLLGKWAIFIILTLKNERLHIAELERRLKTISRKVLAQNLRELEAINIISREGKASTGSPVYYGLTDLGKDFYHFYTK